MSPDENKHSACVRAWMEARASGLAPEARMVLFERALAALWQRAQRTLGEVTVAAVAERVLHTVSEQHRVLTTLEVNATGFRFGEVRPHEDLDRLDDAICLTLVELLRVIGNLTAEILTPALHRELSRVSLDEHADGHAKNELKGSKT